MANSTIEVEYIIAFDANKDAIWIKKFIIELGIIPSIVNLMDLYYDNNGAIAQVKEPRSHYQSKHILQHFHLICQIIKRGDVKICNVTIDDNIVDLLTKLLDQ